MQRGYYEEHSCDIILNLGQWFRRRCCLKDLYGALAALLFGGAELCNFEEGIMGNIHVKLYDIWTITSEGDVV